MFRRKSCGKLLTQSMPTWTMTFTSRSPLLGHRPSVTLELRLLLLKFESIWSPTRTTQSVKSSSEKSWPVKLAKPRLPRSNRKLNTSNCNEKVACEMFYKFDSFKKPCDIRADAKNVCRSTENQNLLDSRPCESCNGRELQDVIRAVLPRAPRVSLFSWNIF